MFWEGFSLEDKKEVGRLCRLSGTLSVVVVVQRTIRSGHPSAMMADLGFGELMLHAAIRVTGAGKWERLKGDYMWHA
jgi:hypothetical protein